jgi:XRE family aerobic/anaerobic benzoate catabolism transcriptional regulator
MPLNPNLLASHPPPPAREGDFLELLGRRVRAFRKSRAVTRKAVAHDARVSERHLAQLESGDGNVSIVLLRRIATALQVSLPELLASEPEGSAERRRIQEFLEGLPAHRLEEVLFRLGRDFEQHENTRRSRIALIGLRGAGKSTLGVKLSASLSVPFLELDHEIEKETGMPLAEIFSLYGQSGYRAIERRALERVTSEHEKAVFSIGGGVVSEKETFDFLLSHCLVVWIKAQPEEHMSRVIAQGDLRAIAGSDRAMEDLRRILESREPLYRKADLTVDTSGTNVEESFGKLKTALEK